MDAEGHACIRFGTPPPSTGWRPGTGLDRLLPALPVRLGHAGPDGTKICLTMTPELLHQASLRFERHVEGGDHD